MIGSHRELLYESFIMDVFFYTIIILALFKIMNVHSNEHIFYPNPKIKFQKFQIITTDVFAIYQCIQQTS